MRDSYGLVLCGGRSSRMKTDKCLLNYFGQPQWQRVYEMLRTFCTHVFISCRADQQSHFGGGYPLIVDGDTIEDSGPLKGLLSAFAKYPAANWFVMGCDYPFLSKEDLQNFSSCVRDDDGAAAFFNETEKLYEPVLGWYSNASARTLNEQYSNGQCSLQQYLKEINARRFAPEGIKVMLSVDTPELMRETMMQLKNEVCR